MLEKGQGALEYLLIIGAAVLISSVVITVLFSVGGEGVDVVNEVGGEVATILENPPMQPSPECGNFAVEEGEECDGYNLNEETCESKGFDEGVLECGEECEFEMYCFSCGDGNCNGTEDCDECIADCGSCPLTQDCGNDIREGTEDCDGTDLASQHCYLQGFDAGTLACTGSCTFNTSGCYDNPPCGNGVIDVGEDCDGSELNDLTCTAFGFAGGTLGCTIGCDFDGSDCTSAPEQLCGNNLRETSEECDGTDLVSETCVTKGFDSGTLGCNDNCTYNTSQCFQPWALFVMPDTQWYSKHTEEYEEANEHYIRMTQWICENQLNWTEPSTGKTMDILAVVQLGDIVQSGRREEQWINADAAFDELDNCVNGVVPYIPVMGNHDYENRYRYHSEADGYNSYFGEERFAPYQCTQIPCEEDKWFIGIGPMIPAYSRTHYLPQITDWGPETDQPGRMRAATIIDPNGQRYLFMGFEHGIDLNNLNWAKQVMDDYLGTPTIITHHGFAYGNGPDDAKIFDIQNLGGTVSNGDVWDELIDAYPQTIQTWNGHFINPTYAGTDGIIKTENGDVNVIVNMRNFQGVGYGNGWNTIAVFDPEDGVVRARNYRISNTDPPGIIEMDHGMEERIYPYDFRGN